MLSADHQKGLEAYIVRDDGTGFAEHSIAHVGKSLETPSTTSCFLESEEGKTFNIIVDTRQAAWYHPKHDWRLSVHVDGRLISCCAIVRYRTSVKKISSIASREDGRLVQGRLSFARLQTTDVEADVTLQAAHFRSIGQIVVDIHRGTRKRRQPGETIIADSGVGVASERGKKLGGAVSSTSREAYHDDRDYVDFDLYDEEDTPFHRFTFNYRTRPVLELMNIVEPLLPPVFAEQPDESSKRKRDANVEGDKDTKAIKLEDVKPSRKALLAAKLADLERQLALIETLPRSSGPSEMIDLTGDGSGED